MALILTLRGPRGRESRTLGSGTLSIGRAPGNDWVLDDPDRLLSKTHCVIASGGGGDFMLTDLSTNGVFLNGATDRVPRGSHVELADGDEFRLGDYAIKVANARPANARENSDRTGGFPPPVGGPDPLGEDPLDDPFGAAPGFVHPVAAPPPRRLDDPFDRADEERPGPSASGFDGDLFAGAIPAESWTGATQPDDVDAPQQAFTAPAAIKPALPSPFDELDIDALLGEEPPGGSPEAALPPPPPAPPPSARQAPPAQAQPPLPVTPPPASVAPASDLLAAFLAGAGVADLAVADAEAAMRSAGAVFRAMVEGIRQVLMSRAAVKNEFRVEQTMLRARDNNALKFSLTVEDALAALLRPDRPGYKPPVDAATEALDDVRAHEMAVMAGVQTALLGLLKRFEPSALEQRLQPAMLDSLLPGARKARTWELFCATYREIAREAEDDFQSVFGREFARAYDAQMRKL